MRPFATTIENRVRNFRIGDTGDQRRLFKSNLINNEKKNVWK